MCMALLHVGFAGAIVIVPFVGYVAVAVLLGSSAAWKKSVRKMALAVGTDA